MKRVVAAMCLCLLLALPVAAQAEGEQLYAEQLEASGAAQLTERLPKDTATLLEAFGDDLLQPSAYVGLRFDTVFRTLGELLSVQRGLPLQALGCLLGVVLVSALFRGMEGTAQSPFLQTVFHMVAALAAAGGLLVPLLSLLEQVEKAVEQVAVFMAGFVPIYGGILATGGVSTALSYQTTLLTAAEALTWLLHSGVFPLLTVSLAMGTTGCVADGFCLDSFSATIHKTILWALGLFSTLFSGLLSLQQMVAAAGDTLGGRVMKFSLSSFVPVVGGLLSEAYSTVVSCSGLLRSTVGCFGMLATVLIILPPLCHCLLWSLSLHLSASAAALFGLSSLEKLCKTAAGTIRVLIGVLAVFALLMVVSVSIVVFAARGR
ncbi:MAG: hypothetical protein IJO76_01310 [Clostridia bacterium]|nr:hypothetical protein [Clostridia bacterium]